MKKFTLALLVGMMVLATASMAAAEITVGGEMEVRYDLWKNMNGATSSTSNTQSFWDQRVLLNVDAKITEGLEAFVELDSTGTSEQWGAGTGVGQGNFNGYLNHQGGTLSVKQAWINFMVPGAPVGMKIGHQPLALGHGIFLDTHRQGSDAILLYSKPIPSLLLAGVYISGFEGASAIAVDHGGNAATNDADFYAVLANYTFMENNTVGMNVTYVVDNNPTALGIIHSGATVRAVNAMLTLDGVVGPVNYKGEVDYLNVSGRRALDIRGQGSYGASAWAAMLGASANVSMLNVGMEVAYGTGNNRNDTNYIYGNQATGALGAGAKDHAYATPYGATSYNYAFLYNDKIGQGVNFAGGGAGFGDGFGGFGLANTGYAKVSVGVKPTDKLSAGMDFLYLRASEAAFSGQSHDLGWEVDANVGYKIYDNLMLDVKGGVFVPGAWYAFNGKVNPAGLDKNTVVSSTDTTTSIKRTPAYGMETKLTVKF